MALVCEFPARTAWFDTDDCGELLWALNRALAAIFIGPMLQVDSATTFGIVIYCSSGLLLVSGMAAWVWSHFLHHSLEKEATCFSFQANLHAFCRAAGKHPTRGAAVPHTCLLYTSDAADE